MKVCELALKEIEFGRSQLILIGGRPAMGKTTFVQSLSVDLAIKGYKVGFYSLEMANDSWIERISKDRKHERWTSLPIDVKNETSINVEYIEKCCLAQKYDLLVVDNLQLIDRGDGSIKDVILALKNLAKKLNIPVIVLSQLSRQIEIRDNHMPKMEDVENVGIEIGLIDQTFLLYRAYYYNRDEAPTNMTIVKKNGEEQLEWDYKSLSVL